jgi:integrase
MPGQIIRRGDTRWLVRVPLGRDTDGTRKYHNRTVHGTKKDAERYRTRILRELDVGTFVQASPQSLGDYLSEWLRTSAAQSVSRRTLRDYTAHVRRHVVPALGHRPLAQLSPKHVQECYARMLAAGLSSRTVRYVHSVLHNALEQAVKWQLLARNPPKAVTLPRQERREMRALNKDDASAFLAAAAGTRFEALWILLLTSGLRPGEALALKWADIQEERVHVQRALARLAWRRRMGVARAENPSCTAGRNPSRNNPTRPPEPPSLSIAAAAPNGRSMDRARSRVHESGRWPAGMARPDSPLLQDTA